jgi:uncharacterized membrane protein
MTSIRTSYPLGLEAAAPGVRPSTRWQSSSPRELRLSRGPGVLVAFDRDVMMRAAAHDEVTVELIPAIGEYVSEGQPLIRIHGNGSVDHRILLSAVTIGQERMVSEPAFALRIIVDTAIRALSPAVNDPTTAVQAIDVLEPMIEEVAVRNLQPWRPDGEAAPRLVWRAPTWEDFLDLAFDEIRAYGRHSIQVCRRLRAALSYLRANTPYERHAAIDVHVARLVETVQLANPTGSPERSLAAVVDRTGLGLARAASPESSYT